MPDPDRSGPAAAVISGGKAYLIDAGAGVVRRAQAAFTTGISQLAPRFLERLFLTHLHSDHTLGLADLILTPAVIGRKSPLRIFGPEGTRQMAEHLLLAFEQDLQIRGEDHQPSDMNGYGVLVQEVEEGTVYRDEHVEVTAFTANHGSWKNAFGYKFTAKDRTIVVSGDTGPNPRIADACNGCDLLVHEVYCRRGFEQGSQSWQRYHSAYHTSSSQLANIASKARPKLLVLYHQLLFGCSQEQLLQELRAGYEGPVIFGNDLDVF